MISKLKQLVAVLVSIDQKLGIRKFSKYLVILGIAIACIPILRDPKGAIKDTVRFIIDISQEIENDKMKERDVLMSELDPLLRELAATTGADRVVYYEYHNSIENEAGIPFKFCDLVQQASRPGLPELTPLSNINVSRFCNLYAAIRDSEVVNNPGDSTFYYKYPGFTEISNGSKRQAFVNIPGINLPLGIVVIEWYSEEGDINWDKVDKSALKQGMRINALMNKLN